MPIELVKKARHFLCYNDLPYAQFSRHAKELKKTLYPDLGAQLAIENGMKWLCLAQDNSKSQDGGIAYSYSLKSGWMTSYPETTGYIVSTFIDQYLLTKKANYKKRALIMLDWLVSIQFKEGGFQGGKIGAEPMVPVTFNTGQILIGLAHACQKLDKKKYLEPMKKAADWLRDSLDEDGCWRKHPTPFAKPTDKSYETHVSWGLFEAARVLPKRGYQEAALKQINWALSRQAENGWFSDCCLENNQAPLTHTIGYVTRGLLEAYLFTKKSYILDKACLTLNHLALIQNANGSIPDRLNKDWKSTVPWICLTGNVQLAHCFLIAYQLTKKQEYLDTGLKINAFVRSTLNPNAPKECLGALKGSYPISGKYLQYQYPNWATKFMIDANQMELDVLKSSKKG